MPVRLYNALASLELTIACLLLLMALVVLCTVSQVELGTFEAVDRTIRSPFVFWRGAAGKVPVFPGGGLVGAVLLANLAAAHFKRFEFSRRKLGLWVIHLGLILLFAGEFSTSLFAVEGQMPVEVGGTKNYSESLRENELAVVDTTDPAFDRVTSVPEARLARGGVIADPALPFSLVVSGYAANASLRPRGPNDPVAAAAAGPGARFVIEPEPPVTSDERSNQPAATIEAVAGGRSAGTWLVSTAFGAPQHFTLDGRTYRLEFRAKRYYLPFSLTLKKFSHDRYPGTDIPKNFSSLVRLNDPAAREDRDVLIYMNNPLRYGGLTFYQASFGKGDQLSVLQVVRNPGWRLPYLACALVAAGLLLHFFTRLSLPAEAA